jgi:hypothetical protein
LLVFAVSTGAAFAQDDKKTDDLKPADPDTVRRGVTSLVRMMPSPHRALAPFGSVTARW